MPSIFRHAAVVLASLTLTAAVPASAQDKPLSPDQLQVVNTVKAVYAAAAADDLSKFHAAVAPSFYIFDGGQRFDGDAIMALIKQLHAAGKHYEWNVTEPDVHINGDQAWVAYVNHGSVTDGSGRHEVQWLESAVLQKQAGTWKIVFMQSTRVPPPTPEAK